MSPQETLSKLQELADNLGYNLTDNAEYLAELKTRMFGDEWEKCPIRKEQEYFCCSQHCQNEIKETGCCFCVLFKRK